MTSKLDQALENLPKELQPKRDLWAGIDHALEQEQTEKSSKTPWLVAASFLAVGFFSWQLTNGGSTGLEGQLLVEQLSSQHQLQRAEILASYICGDPQPIDQDVLEAIHPARFLIRNIIRRKC